MRDSVRVVVKILIQRAADLLHDSTHRLAFENHWIQHHAMIRHHPDLEDIDSPGRGIHFDQCPRRAARMRWVDLRAP